MKNIFKIFSLLFSSVNLKLKSQIIAGYLVMLLLIIILLVNFIFSLNNLDRSSERILKENSVSIEVCLRLNKILVEINNLTLNYINGSIITSSEFNVKVNFYNTSFKENLIIAEKTITEIGEAEIVVNLKNKSNEYFEMIDKFNIKESIGKNYLPHFQDKFRDVSLLINDLFVINQNASYQKNEASRKDFKTAWIYFILIGVIALAIAYITIIKMPAAILKPLEGVTARIIEISNGKYGQAVEEKSKNELGLLASAFNRMSQKLYEYQQSNMSIIVAQKSRIESIVNSLNDAIIVLDEKLDFVLLNPKAIKLLGISDYSIVGKHAADIAVFNNLMHDLLKTVEDPEENSPDKHNHNYIKMLADGKEEYYSKEVIKVYNNESTQEKSFLGYIIELRNVTDFKEIDDAKSNFISTLSHEVRTPLSAMNLNLSLLLNKKIGYINDDQEKIIVSIKDEIQRLLSIIGSLFDLTKFEAGNIKILFQKTEISYLLNYSLAPFYSQIKEKEINLTIENNSAISFVKADPEKLSWVIMNLIGNAIRYTPKNGDLSIRIRNDKNMLEFCIEDSGPGIEEKYLARIFDRFFQVPGKKFENEEGLGLGLAICKEIVQAHKGKIRAESEPGKGTKFYFSIPTSIL